MADRHFVHALATLAPDLAHALGPDHEVVVHDLSLMPNSIVGIGGSITGRSIGGPITDMLLRAIRQGQTDDIFRYRAQTTSGRTLSSSTVFVRQPDGTPTGCLCINRDVTELLSMEAMSRRILEASQPSTEGAVGEEEPEGSQEPERAKETFAPSVEEMAHLLVNRAIATTGVPVELMKKTHKLRVIGELEANGLFLLRDAIELTASMLEISRESVYGYLKELRQEAAADGAGARRPSRPRLAIAGQGTREAGETT